ncbi:type VI secretion system-associated FHA domain protein [Falsirhodobacter sp. 1013]|uniref:type VI secretion system-associated FHA domain protein n=1 Tax=Falsirhodobacter sp. 1013 TaxID=3417566 RepID=UPI003EB81AD0
MGLLLAIEGEGPLPPNLRPDGTIVVEDRLTLGSAPDNGLVLDSAAPVHCLIFDDRGTYQVLDHSQGGTVMNDAAEPLQGGGPVPLDIGDSLLLGGWRLTVLGHSRPAEEAPPEEPEPHFLERVLMVEEDADYAIRRGDTTPPWDDGDGDLFPVEQGASQFDHRDPIHDAYTPARAGTEAIPDDWDLFADIGLPAPVPQAAPQPSPQRDPLPPRPAPAAEAGLAAAFCRGAGLDLADLPPGQEAPTLELAGELLATALAGLHLLLQNGTEGRRAGTELTNPLSLPGTSRDMLRLLLRGPLPNLLPGDMAITRACSDIAAQVEDLRDRLRRVSGIATEMLAPQAIAEAVEPASVTQKLRRMRGGPDPFRRAFEQRHREASLSIRMLAGDDEHPPEVPAHG